MDSLAYLGDLLGGVANAVKPLEDALGSNAAFDALFSQLGWPLDPQAGGGAVASAFAGSRLAGLGQALTAVTTAATTVASAISGSGSAADLVSEIAALAGAIEQLASELSNLGNASPAAAPYPLNTPAFWTSLGEELLGFLLYQELERAKPVAFAVLHALGVFAEKQVPAASSRMPYLSRSVNWDLLVAAVTDLRSVPNKAYGWGTAFTEGQLTSLVNAITALGQAFGLPAGLRVPDSQILTQYFSGNQALSSAVAAVLPLFVQHDSSTGAFLECDLVVLPVPPASDRTAAPSDLLIYVQAQGAVATSFPLATGVTLGVTAGFAADSIQAEIAPQAGKAPSVTLHGAPASGTLSEALTLTAAPATPWVLLGRPDTSRIELDQAHAAVSAAGSGTPYEFKLELGLDAAKVVIDFGESDSFISQFFGDSQQSLSFGLTVAWSSLSGFSVSGNAQLTVQVPVNVTLGGVVEVDSLAVTVAPKSGSAALALAATGGLTLGPIAVTVTNIGIQLVLSPASAAPKQLSLGTADVSFGFKPPDGAGAAIDAGPVGGGGFMSFDETQQQYAGVLEFLVPEVSLTAIGLITTRMPDGSSGFSMLVIISAEFPPIQLGFGFTLNRVGGLLGVNRGVDTDALQAGLKSGTLDSIQFPQNVVANAPKIINDIKTVFPVAQGTYVVGPMVGLGWGTPSLVTLDLGVILELPHPLRLILLGKLAAALPVPDDALVLLQIEVLGILDFDQRTISIDGTLADSRVVTFPISGDMALRASYGSSPTLAMSAGGFNPRFQPPANFPSLDRMAIALADGDNPRLRLEAYFAVTSNTVQAGAQLDLYVDKDFGGLIGDFTVSGELSFDALVKLVPFQIIVDLSAKLEVQRNGDDFCSVELTMTISGPRPWHAWGKATVHVLGCSHSISFDVTIGPSDPPPALPPANPGPDLLAELKTPGNWSAKQPTGSGAMVAFRDGASAANGDTSTALVLHPTGQVTVRQRKVPLDVQIDTYGHQPLAAGPTTYTVTCTDAASSAQPVQDMFAPGDFFPLSDDQKLSAPGFEPFDSGLAITSGALSAGDGNSTTYTYVTEVIDQATVGKPVTRLNPTPVAAAVAAAMVGQSAAAHAGTHTQGDNRFAAPGTPVTLAQPSYALASRATLASRAGSGTYTNAAAARAAAQQTDPVHAGDLQIVDTAEVLA